MIWFIPFKIIYHSEVDDFRSILSMTPLEFGFIDPKTYMYYLSLEIRVPGHNDLIIFKLGIEIHFWFLMSNFVTELTISLSANPHKI